MKTGEHVHVGRTAGSDDESAGCGGLQAGGGVVGAFEAKTAQNRPLAELETAHAVARPDRLGHGGVTGSGIDEGFAGIEIKSTRRAVPKGGNGVGIRGRTVNVTAVVKGDRVGVDETNQGERRKSRVVELLVLRDLAMALLKGAAELEVVGLGGIVEVVFQIEAGGQLAIGGFTERNRETAKGELGVGRGCDGGQLGDLVNEGEAGEKCIVAQVVGEAKRMGVAKKGLAGRGFELTGEAKTKRRVELGLIERGLAADADVSDIPRDELSDLALVAFYVGKFCEVGGEHEGRAGGGIKAVDAAGAVGFFPAEIGAQENGGGTEPGVGVEKQTGALPVFRRGFEARLGQHGHRHAVERRGTGRDEGRPFPESADIFPQPVDLVEGGGEYKPGVRRSGVAERIRMGESERVADTKPRIERIGHELMTTLHVGFFGVRGGGRDVDRAGDGVGIHVGCDGLGDLE